MPGIGGFREPTSADYIFIDSNNRVHLLVPLIGGKTIALDNTCKTRLEIDRFLEGRREDNGRLKSALNVLKDYNIALKHDIKILRPMNIPSILSKKIDRQHQIEHYIKTLRRCIGHRERDYYDNELIYLRINQILESQNNCLGMRLSPRANDHSLAVNKPLFSLQRTLTNGLGPSLRDCFGTNLELNELTTRQQIINAAITHFSDQAPFDFQALQHYLQNEIQQRFSETVDLTTSDTSGYSCFLMSVPTGRIDLRQLSAETPTLIKQGNAYYIYGHSVNKWKLTKLNAAIVNDLNLTFPAIGEEKRTLGYSWGQPKFNKMYSHVKEKKGHVPIIDQAYYKTTLMLDDTATWDEYAPYILQTCLSDVFWNRPNQDLFIEPDPEKLSIKVQFFLAQINIYCHSNGISTLNFGTIFDQTSWRSTIPTTVKKALAEGRRVDSALFDLISKNNTEFNLSRLLTHDDKLNILNNFNEQFKTISDSPHFDEFFVFIPDKKGDFVNHKSRISLHFSDLMKMMFPDDQSIEAKAIHRSRLEFYAYEGAILPFQNDNLSAERDSFSLLLLNMQCPVALVEFLCQKSINRNYQFEEYPYAIFPLMNSKNFDYLRSLMIDKFPPNSIERSKLNSFFQNHEEHQEKIKENYPDELINSNFDVAVDALKKMVTVYKKPRYSWWVRHRNRKQQLTEIQLIIELITQYKAYDIQGRDRMLLFGSILKSLREIEQQIDNERPWFRRRQSDLQRLVQSTITELKEHYHIHDDDMQYLSKPEMKYIANQQTILRTSNRHFHQQIMDAIDHDIPMLGEHFLNDHEQQFSASKQKIIDDPDSPFHQLNSSWWSPENALYLTNIISLSPFFHTKEAIAFFNATPPDKFDKFFIKTLEEYQPDFKMDIKIESLLAISRANFNLKKNRMELNYMIENGQQIEYKSLFSRLNSLLDTIDPNLFKSKNLPFLSRLNSRFLTSVGLNKLNHYLRYKNDLDISLALGLNHWLKKPNRSLEHDPLPSIADCREQGIKIQHMPQPTTRLSKAKQIFTPIVQLKPPNNDDKLQPLEALIPQLEQAIDELCKQKTGAGKGILQGIAKNTGYRIGLFKSQQGRKLTKHTLRFTQITSELARIINEISAHRDAHLIDTSGMNDRIQTCLTQLTATLERYKISSMSSYTLTLNDTIDGLSKCLTNDSNPAFERPVM